MTILPAKGVLLPTLAIAAIDQIEVDAYLAASGDDNPIHRSAEIAARAGLSGIPVPGMLVMAQVARCAQAWSHCATITRLTARFFAPVLIDRALQVKARVVMLHEAKRRAVLRITVVQLGAIAVMAEADVALVH
jgi:acyl dehydratase